LKRLFDIVVASVMLLCFSPVLLVAMVLVRLKMGAPILFHQLRPGLRGEIFQMVKLRTMLDANDTEGNPLPDDQRMTKLGSILRSTSVDEFPALWNVIKGDMSLVGPRPLMVRYLPRYNKRQARRHEVKPGITGWAQVNGRNAVGWEKRFELDVWYVENQSFWLDIKIMFLTAWKVVRRDGISAPGEATMTEFMGSPTNSNTDAPQATP
jgi:lipopolysaccharide/colanic/teichoic acid biosynthesis glycosyltransferase